MTLAMVRKIARRHTRKIDVMMTQDEIAKARLVNQKLLGSTFTSVVKVVRWLCAVQAQEYAHTKWAIGLRLPGSRDVDIESAFNAGKILRTHILRPTWHFVSAADIRWLLALSAPRVHQANAFMYRQLELDGRTFKKCNDILVNLLRDGQYLTRDEINAAFLRGNVLAKGDRLSYIIMYAELEGIICSGPRRGSQFTYALMDERVKLFPIITKDEALDRLAKQYFSSRGPATIRDFSTWSGLTIAECKRAVDIRGRGLRRMIVDDEEYVAARRMPVVAAATGEIYLLPIYDELVMGYKDRKAMFQHKHTIRPDPPMRFHNTIVEDGQVIGTWRRTLKRSQIELEVDFFSKTDSKPKRSLSKAVSRYQEFCGTHVALC